MMIWSKGSKTYQFGGFEGPLSKRGYVLIDAPKYELMHWILTVAGYSCCPADVMKRCGEPVDSRGENQGLMIVP